MIGWIYYLFTKIPHFFGISDSSTAIIFWRRPFGFFKKDGLITKERRSYASKVDIARDIKNRSNRLDYNRQGKLKTNIKWGLRYSLSRQRCLRGEGNPSKLVNAQP